MLDGPPKRERLREQLARDAGQQQSSLAERFGRNAAPDADAGPEPDHDREHEP